MTISTIAMCQNCSISLWADPGVAKKNPHTWATPDVIMTCRVFKEMFAEPVSQCPAPGTGLPIG